MNFKKNQGFTLVELIVVIAILGLLAGIGIPMYSGYVEKADKAVEVQNITMFHNAYVVACVSNELDPNAFTPGLNWSAGVFTGLSALAPRSGEETPAMKAVNEFNAYFGFPGKSFTFKHHDRDEVADGIMNGVAPAGGSDVKVVENEDGTFTYTAGNLSVTLSAKDAAILAGDNAFSDRGSAALLNDVAVLENLLATGIGDDILTAVVGTKDFEDAMGGYLGLTQGADESDADYAARVAAELQKTDDPQSALYSAQIMYAASQAANATDKQISDLFTGTVTSNIEVKNDDGTTDYAATMANAALAYGMYTAYVQQNNIDTSTNAGNFTNVINSDDFATYYAEQGQTDLEAYQAAMNMISDNTGNSDVTSSILANGIEGNADLEALMKEVMGS